MILKTKESRKNTLEERFIWVDQRIVFKEDEIYTI